MIGNLKISLLLSRITFYIRLIRRSIDKWSIIIPSLSPKTDLRFIPVCWEKYVLLIRTNIQHFIQNIAEEIKRQEDASLGRYDSRLSLASIGSCGDSIRSGAQATNFMQSAIFSISYSSRKEIKSWQFCNLGISASS